MGKRGSRKADASGKAGEEKPLQSPFAKLQGLRESLPPGESLEMQPAAERAPRGTSPLRAVVRYQRKGRGGKDVTLVEQLDLPEEELRAWLKEMRQRLGCGGGVEGDVLVLQGDQRERLPELLLKRGIVRLSVS